jgi:hypothetical protein
LLNIRFDAPLVPDSTEKSGKMIAGEVNRRSSWTVAVASVIGVAFLAASHFINPIIRDRIERAMNRSLVGYQTRLESAHLRWLDGTLFLTSIRK